MQAQMFAAPRHIIGVHEEMRLLHMLLNVGNGTVEIGVRTQRVKMLQL